MIGLAVMGQNLILNMNDHGFTVVAYNRTISKVDDFLNDEAKDTNIIGARSIEEMIAQLKRTTRYGEYCVLCCVVLCLSVCVLVSVRI